MIKVDAMVDACPIPVVKTKNAIKELKGAAGQVETLVDNEISVQNLTKMARQKGYGVRSEKLADQEFRVVMDIPAVDAGSDLDPANSAASTSIVAEAKDRTAVTAPGAKDSTAANPTASAAEEGIACIPDGRKNTVVVISSDKMGGGSDELGEALLKSFLFALSQQDDLPSLILFYNGGAKMTVEDSPALEDIQSMEAQGVEILTCGTCLNYYGLTEKLAVGEVTNMYVIVERMSQASLIIKPC